MTPEPPRILGIGAATQVDSRTMAAVELVLEGAMGAGATTDRLLLGDLSLPLADDRSQEGSDASALCDRIDAADAVVLGTPVYNGSLSPRLKNALDLLPTGDGSTATAGPLWRKLVLPVVVGGSRDHLLVIRELAGALVSIYGAWVQPPGLYVEAADLRAGSVAPPTRHGLVDAGAELSTLTWR